MEIGHAGGFEGHRAADHRKEQHSQTPEVHCEALVPLVRHYFRSYVRRSAALVLHHLVRPNYLANSEIAYFDSEIAINEDVVQFDVSVDD